MKWSLSIAQKKINHEIFRLATPNVLSNVSVPLLSSVDTMLMGKLSATAVAAVGLGSMVFNYLYWNMGFLRMSTTGLTAQAYGREDDQEVTDTLIRATILALVISLIFILAQSPLLDLSAWAMAVDTSNYEEVKNYYNIRIWGAPAALIQMVLFGWFFGVQNARIPLVITILVNVLNIGLSMYLVLQLKLGISGVAWGTVGAQYGGCLLAMILLLVYYRRYVMMHWTRIKDSLGGLMRLIRINQDIFLRTLFLSTSFVLILRFSQQISPDILAINVVFLQYLNWMSYAIDGFAYAAESLVGKYKGAVDGFHLRLTIQWNFVWGFIGALLFSLVYGLFADELFQVFMEEDYARLKAMASSYYVWMVVLPIAGFACYIWDGIFVGLTASKGMRNSMFLAFVVFLLAYFMIPDDLGNHRIWLSFTVFLVFRTLFQYILYRHLGWVRLT